MAITKTANALMRTFGSDLKNPLTSGFGALDYTSGTTSAGGAVTGAVGGSLGYSAGRTGWEKAVKAIGDSVGKSNASWSKYLKPLGKLKGPVGVVASFVPAMMGYSAARKIGDKAMPINKRT